MDDVHRLDLRQPGAEGDGAAAMARRVPGPDRVERDRSQHDPRDDARGRHAESAGEIPKLGWKDILLRVYRGLSEDRILMNAAAVTFYSLLALFPAIAALVSIYGLFADPNTIARQMSGLSGIVPGGGVTVIEEQLTRLAAQGSGSLTIGLVIGVLVSLWSANGGMKGLFDALNVVYGEREDRSFVRLNAVSLAFTLAMLGFAMIALAAIVVLPMILGILPDFIATVIDIARWPLMALLVAVALAFIYRYGPNRDKPKWRWISWGSVVAAVLWLAFSGIYSFYAANFGTFNQTYGSLGAVIGFMLWMWLSFAVILLGGKLNAEIEHQTMRDTTEGAPQPLGQRGAQVADTIGREQS